MPARRALFQHRVEVLRQPCEHAGQTIATRASLGIALAPEHDRDSVELMKDADLALYRAKANGRNMAIVYEPAMRAAMARRVAVCQGLAGALKQWVAELEQSSARALVEGVERSVGEGPTG